MDKTDKALALPNPRLLNAGYFSLLAIILTLVINLIIFGLGFEQLIPIWQLIILAVVIASCFGALFGEAIVHSNLSFYGHVFWLGFLMNLVALPFYDIGLLFLLISNNTTKYSDLTFLAVGKMYLEFLYYSILIAGIWIAILAGFAAVFLRKKVVYYFLASH